RARDEERLRAVPRERRRDLHAVRQDAASGECIRRRAALGEAEVQESDHAGGDRAARDRHPRGPTPDAKGKPDGKPFIDLLDAKTGVSLWKKPFRDLEEATTFAIQGDHLYIAADGELHGVNLADGAD